MKRLLAAFLLASLSPAFAAAPAARPRAVPAPAAQLPGSYDPQNPYARILRGELPATKVYEDAHVLAFLATSQEVPGHVLVVSKASKAKDGLDIAPAEFARAMLAAQRIARAERAALGADGFEISQPSGAAAGQTVFQFHIHVIPHWRDGGPISLPQAADGRLDRAALAARIAAAMH
jgi:histidine triad (HIT) family protein